MSGRISGGSATCTRQLYNTEKHNRARRYSELDDCRGDGAEDLRPDEE